MPGWIILKLRVRSLLFKGSVALTVLLILHRLALGRQFFRFGSPSFNHVKSSIYGRARIADSSHSSLVATLAVLAPLRRRVSCPRSHGSSVVNDRPRRCRLR